MVESNKIRRFYALALCLIVFSFFVHAKLAGYSPSSLSSGGAVHRVSQSQKLDLNKAGKLLLPILLVWLVLTCRKGEDYPTIRRSTGVARAFLPQGVDPDRFLRPPPSVPIVA